MKTRVNIILLLICFQFTYTQNQKVIDSLTKDYQSRELDSFKVKTLHTLIEKIMFKDPELAYKYAKESLELSKKINYAYGEGGGYLAIGNYFSNKADYDSATYHYLKAEKIFEVIKSNKGFLFSNHMLADIERLQGNYDKAISYINKNLKTYTNKKDIENLKGWNLIGSEYELLGKIYINKGNYIIATKETLNALRFFEKTNDSIRKADALNQLSSIESIQSNFRKSYEYATDAYSIYKKFDDKFYMSYAANNAGSALINLNDLNNAKKQFENSISVAKEVNNKLALLKAKASLGLIYSKEKKYFLARKELESSLAMAKEVDSKLDISDALMQLASLDVIENNPKNGLLKVQEVIRNSSLIGARDFLSKAYKKESVIYETLNNDSKALASYKKYTDLKDSIYNISKSQQIEELKTIYETEKKETALALQEEEINTLNAQAKVDKLTKGIYGGSAIGGLVLSGLLFFVFRQRTKKNKLEREKLDAELAFKKKELASQTLHLVQKNTFLQELKENLENLKNSPEKFKVEFRRIVMLLKKQNADNKDWEVFKSYFSEVHDNFDKKIKQVYNDITEKELRLASFIKMNLSTKEIAAMLNVLPDSVLKSKYRLKKKLGLGKETDLYNYLIEL